MENNCMDNIKMKKGNKIKQILFIVFLVLEAIYHIRVTIWPIQYPEMFDAIMNLAFLTVCLFTIWAYRDKLENLNPQKDIKTKNVLYFLAVLAAILWATGIAYILTLMVIVITWMFMDDEKQFRIRFFVHLSLFSATILGLLTGIIPYYEDVAAGRSFANLGYSSAWTCISIIFILAYSLYAGKLLKSGIAFTAIRYLLSIAVILYCFRGKTEQIVYVIKNSDGYYKCIIVMILFLLAGILLTYAIYRISNKKSDIDKKNKWFYIRRIAAGLAAVIMIFGISRYTGPQYEELKIYEKEADRLREVNDLDEYLSLLADQYYSPEYDIIIAASDTLGSRINENVDEKLSVIGSFETLTGRGRNAYAAILEDGYAIYEELEEQENVGIIHDETVKGTNITIQSMPFYAGAMARIVIDGRDYAINKRGLNVVVYNNELRRVMDSVAFDTYEDEYYISAVREKTDPQ